MAKYACMLEKYDYMANELGYMANELGYMPEENGNILNQYSFYVGKAQLYDSLSLIATMFAWHPVCNASWMIKQQLSRKSYFTFSYCVINSPIIITTGNIYLNYMMATLAGWGNKWII